MSHEPQTLDPKPLFLKNPKLQLRNPKLSTLDFEPQTPNPSP